MRNVIRTSMTSWAGDSGGIVYTYTGGAFYGVVGIGISHVFDMRVSSFYEINRTLGTRAR